MIGAAEPRPFASLSSGLLARKGQAKPAMRPQGFGGFGNMTMGHEDLGWNDMGYDTPAPGTPAPAAATPAPRPVDPAAFDPAPPPPAVHAQFDALEAEFGDESEPVEEAPRTLLQVKSRTPVPVAEPVVETQDAPEALEEADCQPAEPAPAVAPARSGGKKAAFTLRLDADRHLRLRLASAVQNRSSQLLVTEALDRFLDSLPVIDKPSRD